MSEENVKRLQGDLLAIRNAMQLDPPYAPSDVPMHLLMGFSGLVAMVLLEFTSWDRRLCLCLPLVPDMIAYTLRYLKVRQNRERRPVLAREYQIGMVVATVAAVATGGWMWWCRRLAIPRELAAAPLVFCLGVMGCVIGLWDRQRRSFLPVSVAAMVWGILMPLLPPRQMELAIAIGFAVSGFGTAAVVAFQARHNPAAHEGEATR